MELQGYRVQREDYKLFECTDQKLTCIYGILCPCMLCARTYERSRDLDGESGSFFTAMCAYLVGLVTCLVPLCQCMLSHQAYPDGCDCGDCVSSTICYPCKNCQDANNVDHAWSAMDKEREGLTD
jgi:hypothetical protein